MKGINYVKTHFTLLESNIKISKLIAKAIENKTEYITVVDSNHLFYVPDLINRTKKTNIKPILGLEITLNLKYYKGQILLIAFNNEGFYNLVKLSSIVSNVGQEITWEVLQKNNRGLNIILPSHTSPLHSILRQQDFTKVSHFLKDLKTIFKQVYLGINAQEIINKQFNIISIAKENNVPVIFANCGLVINKEDTLIPEILKAISEGRKANQNSSLYEYNYIWNNNEINELIPPEIIKQTNAFFHEHYFSLEFKKTNLISFPCPNNMNSDVFLQELCRKGLMKRSNNQPTKQYLDRLKKELDIIFKLKFTDYFLVVWDFIRFAYKEKILFGPGRGSAAGSLVSYCLGITNIDPIKYGLIFERFLNYGRKGLPDIDIDFEDTRREEVINYVLEKYGYDHVCYISTFQTLKAKMALRDVGRALDISLLVVDKIAKAVPGVLNITLQEAYENNRNFKERINENEKTKQLFLLAQKIENNPRQLGTHAAGIIFSEKPLTAIVPLVNSATNVTQTQFSMYHLESLGLLKMDFLGLRNLTTIQEICLSIKHHFKKTINIREIPCDDQKTFRLLQEVKTEGLFQLESPGMRNVLKLIQCKTIEDLAITIALYRPGPMSNIKNYINQRNNPSTINYIDENLKSILKQTHGIIIYQEQTMQIVSKVANFSNVEADFFRRAISKKDINLMQNLKKSFMDGAKANGYSEAQSRKIYDLIYQFANYGFNKAHATSYAMIAYQLAYLKANYPLSFMASLLSGFVGNENKINHYINECKKMNINILKPSINYSFKTFNIENNNIRFSLISISGMGISSYNTIYQERKKSLYKSFKDFIIRMIPLKLKKQVIESLIWSGAFDEFGHGREALFESLPDFLRYGEIITNSEGVLIQNNNDFIPTPLIRDKKDNLKKILELEKKYLGFFFSGHPLKKLKKEIMKKKGLIRNICNLEEYSSYKRIVILGEIKTIRRILTKTKKQMAFINIYDDTGTIRLILFPDTYLKLKDIMKIKNIYCFVGRLDKENSNNFIVDNAKNIKTLINTKMT